VPGEADVVVGTVPGDAVVDVAGEVVSVDSGALAVDAWDEVVELAAPRVSLVHDVTSKAVATSDAQAVWRTWPSLKL
jgi:hypothetical protein